MNRVAILKKSRIVYLVQGNLNPYLCIYEASLKQSHNGWIHLIRLNMIFLASELAVYIRCISGVYSVYWGDSKVYNTRYVAEIGLLILGN